MDRLRYFNFISVRLGRCACALAFVRVLNGVAGRPRTGIFASHHHDPHLLSICIAEIIDRLGCACAVLGTVAAARGSYVDVRRRFPTATYVRIIVPRWTWRRAWTWRLCAPVDRTRHHRRFISVIVDHRTARRLVLSALCL